MMSLENGLKKGLLLVSLLIISDAAVSQDSTIQADKKLDVSGAITVTSDGISTIPAFNLGKPAAIIQMSVGKRLTFEPDLRYALNGKPWNLILWLKYKFIKMDNFYLKAGVNTSYNFYDIPNLTDATDKISTAIRKNFTADIDAVYSINKKVDAGFYYMYVHGFDDPVPGLPTNVHYIALNSTIKKMSLIGDFFLTVKPQIYYLQIDRDHGFYASADVTLGRRNLPFSIAARMNKHIHTQIAGNPDPNWNIGLVYSFDY